MQPIYPQPRPDPLLESPTKKFRSLRISPEPSPGPIHSLTDEMIVHIASFLLPSELCTKFALASKYFCRIAMEEYEKEAYRSWWQAHLKSTFPESSSNYSTETSIFFQMEMIAKNKMVSGEYTLSSLNYVPNLVSVAHVGKILLFHTTTALVGIDMEMRGQAFIISEVVSTYAVYQNTFFAFLGKNQVHCYTLSPEDKTCARTRELKGIEPNREQACIKQAKIFWPYLIGFSEEALHVWDVHHSVEPKLFPLDFQFITLHRQNLVYLKENRVTFLSLKNFEERSLTIPENFQFDSDHIHIHRDCLIVCGKQLKMTISLTNLSSQENKLIQLNLQHLPTGSLVYEDTLYCWHETQGVLAALDLLSWEKKEVKPLIKKKWKVRTAPKNPTNLHGSKHKLINGLVFTRKYVLDLKNNTRADIGDTTCFHNIYALDYSKVTYFDGFLVKSYPCSRDEPNIFFLNFNEERK